MFKVVSAEASVVVTGRLCVLGLGLVRLVVVVALVVSFGLAVVVLEVVVDLLVVVVVDLVGFRDGCTLERAVVVVNNLVIVVSSSSPIDWNVDNLTFSVVDGSSSRTVVIG